MAATDFTFHAINAKHLNAKENWIGFNPNVLHPKRAKYIKYVQIMVREHSKMVFARDLMYSNLKNGKYYAIHSEGDYGIDGNWLVDRSTYFYVKNGMVHATNGDYAFSTMNISDHEKGYTTRHGNSRVSYYCNEGKMIEEDDCRPDYYSDDDVTVYDTDDDSENPCASKGKKGRRASKRSQGLPQ